jgi:bifunctional DNA primase/polymerase-like protein/primase-like protein/uncharacterized protein DUF3987
MSCENSALELLDYGISVIPIVPRGKKPPYKFQWKEFQKRRATPEEVEAWFEKWPDANLAIVCGAISNLWVFDIDGPAGAEWFRRECRKSTAYSKTGKPHAFHAFYRPPEGVVIKNAVGYRSEVDIRGEGGYVVCPPSIHPSGVAYAWHFEPGMDGWDDLPEWEPSVPANCQGTSPDSSNKGTHIPVDLSNVSYDIEGARVPQGGRNQALAIKAGRWISKGHTVEEALDLAEGWNKRYCQPPLGIRELQTTVQSIYRSDKINHPERQPVENLSGLVPVVPAADEPLAAGEDFPEELLNPGGLLGEIMEYIDRSTATSFRQFNLAAAIALLGAIAGQRVMTDTELRTNMYCVCLGYSGCGKNAAHHSVPNLLMKAECHVVLGANDPTSASAIMHWLAQEGRQRTLMTIDEVGLLYQAIKKPHSPAAEIPRTMMELFSATGHGYIKSYASKEPVVLRWHHLSMYGTSTPTSFWGGMTGVEAGEGFLARLLVFESDHEAVEPKDQVNAAVPVALVTALDNIWNIPVETTGGNIARIPVPLKVPLTDEARVALAKWKKRYFDLRNTYRKEPAGSLYGRVAEHAAKLALIHAVSYWGAGVTEQCVSLAAVEWATRLMDHLIVSLVEKIKENVADNDWDKKELTVIKTIKRYRTSERPGASAAQIGNYLSCNKRTRDSVIETMVSNGRLVMEEHKPQRGPSTKIYCIAEKSKR